MTANSLINECAYKRVSTLNKTVTYENLGKNYDNEV